MIGLLGQKHEVTLMLKLVRFKRDFGKFSTDPEILGTVPCVSIRLDNGHTRNLKFYLLPLSELECHHSVRDHETTNVIRYSIGR